MSSEKIVCSWKDNVLYSSDLELLEEGRWLNDSILVFALEYAFQTISSRVRIIQPSLIQLALNSPPHLAQSIVQTTGSKEWIFIPVNDSENSFNSSGSHWTALVYQQSIKRAFYFDSLSLRQRSNWRLALKIIDGLVPTSDDHRQQITVTCLDSARLGLVQSDNGWDCGVFVLLFAEMVKMALIQTTNTDLADYLYSSVKSLNWTPSSYRKYLRDIIVAKVGINQKSSRKQLPAEILRIIWSHLGMGDKYQLLTTCKSWFHGIVPELYRDVELTLDSLGGNNKHVELVLGNNNSSYPYHSLYKSLSINHNQWELSMAVINKVAPFVHRLTINEGKSGPKSTLSGLIKFKEKDPFETLHEITVKGSNSFDNTTLAAECEFELITWLINSPRLSLTLTRLEFVGVEWISNELLLVLGWPDLFAILSSYPDRNEFVEEQLRIGFQNVMSDTINWTPPTIILPPNSKNTKFPSLKYLRLEENYLISEHGIAALILGPACPNLEEIKLRRCTNVMLTSNESITRLNKLRQSATKVCIVDETQDYFESESEAEM